MMRHYWGFPRHLGYRLPTEFNGGRRLPIDVQADELAYLITAEVPGMSVEDLQVEVLDDLITLRGEYKAEEAAHRQAQDAGARAALRRWTKTRRFPLNFSPARLSAG